MTFQNTTDGPLFIPTLPPIHASPSPKGWKPGQNPRLDLHMGLTIAQLVFYGVIFLIAAFFFIARNRCRFLVNGWWINLIMVCFCRIGSCGMTIKETLQTIDGIHGFNWNIYGGAVMNDVLCLVAFYILHLTFVERLCHAAAKWSLVALCGWITLSHFLAQPFFIAATWKILKEKNITGDVRRNVHQGSQQIGTYLLLVGMVIGLYCFLVQSIFAVVAVTSNKRATSNMRVFEAGILVMIPLILTRLISIVLMFFTPFTAGPRYTYSLMRFYIEIIPENITAIVALILAFMAPNYLPERPYDGEKDENIFQGECPVEPCAAGMAFTPLKLNSTNILMTWYNSHLRHPFPTDEEKSELVLRTGFTMEMIDSWFEDTRVCTRMQRHSSENPGVSRVSERTCLQSTDGSYDMQELPEARPMPTRNASAPPIMIGPSIRGDRIESLTFEQMKRAQLGEWMKPSHANSRPRSRQNYIGQQPQMFRNLKRNAALLKPVHLNRSVGRAKSTKEWEQAFGLRMNATRMHRIKELTYESSEERRVTS